MKVYIIFHSPSIKLGGISRSFKSARLARVWLKEQVKQQTCSWSVCSISGWRGNKRFLPSFIPNPW